MGALRGTIASDWLDEHAAGVATIELYDSQPGLLHALARARMDAVFGYALGLHAWLMGPTASAFSFVGEGIELDEGIGIAVRRVDEDLRLRINAAMRVVIADGAYRRINARYFPFDIC